MIEDSLSFEIRDADRFMDAIAVEQKAADTRRFSWRATNSSDNVEFNIRAQDPTAMKAAKSSIKRLVTIYRKVTDFKAKILDE